MRKEGSAVAKHDYHYSDNANKIQTSYSRGKIQQACIRIKSANWINHKTTSNSSQTNAVGLPSEDYHSNCWIFKCFMRIAHKSLLQENENISENNLSILMFECINKKELCWGVPRHRFSAMYRWKDNFRVNHHFRGMTTKKWNRIQQCHCYCDYYYHYRYYVRVLLQFYS